MQTISNITSHILLIGIAVNDSYSLLSVGFIYVIAINFKYSHRFINYFTLYLVFRYCKLLYITLFI